MKKEAIDLFMKTHIICKHQYDKGEPSYISRHIGWNYCIKCQNTGWKRREEEKE